jgi:signal transduction histidine kinase
MDQIIDLRRFEALHRLESAREKRGNSVVYRLLEAQEEERRRIARDMHDDLGSRIAELALSIHQIITRSPELSETAVADLDGLLEKTAGLSGAIRSISHQLHSPVLTLVGLPGALRSLCRQFQASTGIRVFLTIGRDVEEIPGDAALSLYRIAQESLNNIGRHSGASTARVRLTRKAHEVQLTISDSGNGFTSESRSKDGLGLISMEERARALHGTFKIRTQPGAGTHVRAAIPLSLQSSAVIHQIQKRAGESA